MGVHASRKSPRTKGGPESSAEARNHQQLDRQVSMEMPGGIVTIPEEILILILSFLPEEDLKNCSRVSSLFRSLVKSSSLWKMKCQREGIYVQRNMAPFIPSDWRTFHSQRPFSRNLIKNPSGKEKFKHWKKLQDGGDCWIVEKPKAAGSGARPPELLALSDGSPCSFATSYGWCTKCQVINLVKEGFEVEMLDKLQPPFKVGEWYAARFDCGNVYQIEVVLQKTKDGEDQGDILDTFKFEEQTPQWAPNDWKEVSHVFRNYGPGLRFIKFTHGSKDTQFWAGHYGAKMGGSYVKVCFEKDTKEAPAP